MPVTSLRYVTINGVQLTHEEATALKIAISGARHIFEAVLPAEKRARNELAAFDVGNIIYYGERGHGARQKAGARLQLVEVDK